MECFRFSNHSSPVLFLKTNKSKSNYYEVRFYMNWLLRACLGTRFSFPNWDLGELGA